ncbi:MAG TPA: hypothetical protein VMO17_03520, partial [Terriglobia bacterium]|nr:hypothetical protein [Terriglobia bacterium]
VYWWASDSNVDWNQALPEVENFVLKNGLKSEFCFQFPSARPIPPEMYFDPPFRWRGRTILGAITRPCAS